MKVLFSIDVFITMLFSIEVLIKVIAKGLLLNGKKSYLRSIWNLLDITIVMISLLSISIDND